MRGEKGATGGPRGASTLLGRDQIWGQDEHCRGERGGKSTTQSQKKRGEGGGEDRLSILKGNAEIFKPGVGERKRTDLFVTAMRGVLQTGTLEQTVYNTVSINARCPLLKGGEESNREGPHSLETT